MLSSEKKIVGARSFDSVHPFYTKKLKQLKGGNFQRSSSNGMPRNITCRKHMLPKRIAWVLSILQSNVACVRNHWRGAHPWLGGRPEIGSENRDLFRVKNGAALTGATKRKRLKYVRLFYNSHTGTQRDAY
jgi:hypothetical protein